MTDPARACAEEIYGMIWGANNGERHEKMIVSEIMHRLSKHFPPAVPCEKLRELEVEFWRLGYQLCATKVKALIAEAEK